MPRRLLSRKSSLTGIYGRTPARRDLRGGAESSPGAGTNPLCARATTERTHFLERETGSRVPPVGWASPTDPPMSQGDRWAMPTLRRLLAGGWGRRRGRERTHFAPAPRRNEPTFWRRETVRRPCGSSFSTDPLMVSDSVKHRFSSRGMSPDIKASPARSQPHPARVADGNSESVQEPDRGILVRVGEDAEVSGWVAMHSPFAVRGRASLDVASPGDPRRKKRADSRPTRAARPDRDPTRCNCPCSRTRRRGSPRA